MLTQKIELEAKPKIPEEIWVLVVAAFIIALGYGLIAPILPQFVVGFDVSFAAASAVVSIFAGAGCCLRRCRGV